MEPGCEGHLAALCETGGEKAVNGGGRGAKAGCAAASRRGSPEDVAPLLGESGGEPGDVDESLSREATWLFPPGPLQVLGEPVALEARPCRDAGCFSAGLVRRKLKAADVQKFARLGGAEPIPPQANLFASVGGG